MALKGLKIMSKLRNIKPRLKCLPHVEEYCENSSIHGFSYFSNKRIHVFERIWWMFCVILSVAGCSMLIVDSYRKWNESPVIVTFSEKMVPVKDIPFPAVTICPETKSRNEVFNFTDAIYRMINAHPPYYGLSHDEYELTSTQYQLCDQEIKEELLRFFDERFAKDTIFDLIKDVAPNWTESIESCRFRGVRSFCEGFFQNIMTEEGLCFTFNSLIYEEMFHDDYNHELLQIVDDYHRGVSGHWSMEDGYDDTSEAELSTYPFRVFTAGSSVGLMITLTLAPNDMDYLCRGPVQGFKVILHSPNELPDVNGKYFRVPINQDIRMSIKPNILVTSKSLMDYSTERRQCYFNAERKLQFMRSYTQQNCYLECMANFTLKICGCVKFSMPRDINAPICGAANAVCSVAVSNILWEDEEDTVSKICNCLPACTSISYDAEISQATYDIEKYAEALDESVEKLQGHKMSRLSIFFKENQFTSSKRSELIGMTDFIAACGGLLGLFMGISLLSIVEFVYYFSLRLFCSARSKNSNIDPEKCVAHENGQFAQKYKDSKRRKIYW